MLIIQPANAGNRYLSKPVLTKIQNLLCRMNSQTVYKSDEFIFDSKMLSMIKTNEGKLVDQRYLIMPSESAEKGKSQIELFKTKRSGKEKILAKLEIDIQTGEILNIKKSCLVSLKKVAKRMENFLSKIASDFDNPEVAERFFIELQGYTNKGIEKFRTAQNSINKSKK